MKILQIVQIHWYNAEVQYCYDLAEGLCRLGHEVHVLTRKDSLSAEKARERGFTLFEEDGFNGKGLAALGAFSAAGRLLSFLKRERYDIVEVHRSEGLFLIGWACRRAGVPLVRVRGDMRPVKANIGNRYVYRGLVDGVVATNSTIFKGLSERIGGIEKLATIHGGVDEREFSPEGELSDLRESLGFSAKDFLIGIVGRLSPVKGHDHFIEAAKGALREDSRLAFVILAKSFSAKPEELERLRALVGDEPLFRERIRLLDHRADLPATLREFDLGAVTSVGSEANCRVGLEWMASGKPLLATRIGVLPDIVEEGVTGLLVPPGDRKALQRSFVNLASDREKTRLMGQRARFSVEERFTLSKLSTSHEVFLSDILSSDAH